jgi:hypothetical protein
MVEKELRLRATAVEPALPFFLLVLGQTHKALHLLYRRKTTGAGACALPYILYLVGFPKRYPSSQWSLTVACSFALTDYLVTIVKRRKVEHQIHSSRNQRVKHPKGLARLFDLHGAPYFLVSLESV